MLGAAPCAELHPGLTMMGIGLAEQLRLLDPLKLGRTQREIVLEAFVDAPTGTLTVLRQSRAYGLSRGNTGAALLMHRIAKGEHLDIDFAIDRPAQITGWRRVRGSHGESMVRHPEGTDPAP